MPHSDRVTLPARAVIASLRSQRRAGLDLWPDRCGFAHAPGVGANFSSAKPRPYLPPARGLTAEPSPFMPSGHLPQGRCAYAIIRRPDAALSSIRSATRSRETSSPPTRPQVESSYGGNSGMCWRRPDRQAAAAGTAAEFAPRDHRQASFRPTVTRANHAIPAWSSR